ncbi:uncharacterized protein LOC121421386 isoform X2 [Lytechinus variegatus]|uniref:uncharacterized protein LOC121421386 isoform X2 n=1 Tax=Lytechinus variegatus TaxID=7654 RepID=UPI001BB1E9D4|nr:uncharacterized protein LOC121421386 isoform X2 [Lytechinus variegatus]
MMDFKASIIFMVLCSVASVVCRCPRPTELPITYGKKFFCARAYDHASRAPHMACKGGSLDFVNTGFASLDPPWNDRISAVVVRPGCTLLVFEHLHHEGASLKLTTGVHNLLNWWGGVISSLNCDCEYSNAPLTCTPQDYFQDLDCENNNAGDMQCTYQVQTGMTLGKSVTNGKSVSTTVEASIGLEIKEVFSLGLKVSSTTSFNWSRTTSKDFSTVTTHRVTCTVPEGHHQLLRQVIGKCGDTVMPRTPGLLLWLRLLLWINRYTS